ncbi:MAG: hypothetical protein NTX25_07725, partial [Proteobacteria bacterium]|nr:hypothetical protein [Pseudomonadota bacterium]
QNAIWFTQLLKIFLYGTDEISRGTVSYPVLGNDFYLHRNCKSPCETTLVVVFVDRRDESAAGTRRRELCEICIEILQKRLQLEESVARDLLLSILANKLIPTHQSKS